MDRRCNYCLLEDARRFAASIDQELALRPRRIYEADEQCSETYHSATGVDVEIGGARFTWFAALPERCVCS